MRLIREIDGQRCKFREEDVAYIQPWNDARNVLKTATLNMKCLRVAITNLVRDIDIALNNFRWVVAEILPCLI